MGSGEGEDAYLVEDVPCGGKEALVVEGGDVGVGGRVGGIHRVLRMQSMRRVFVGRPSRTFYL